MSWTITAEMPSVPRQVVAISPLPPIIARGQAGFPAQELREMAGISETFKKIMRKAGVDSQTVKGKGNQMFSKRSFHALRHSFTSALANQNVSSELRMKLTGHSTEGEHKKYTHHEMDNLRAAVEKIPSLG